MTRCLSLRRPAHCRADSDLLPISFTSFRDDDDTNRKIEAVELIDKQQSKTLAGKDRNTHTSLQAGGKSRAIVIWQRPAIATLHGTQHSSIISPSGHQFNTALALAVQTGMHIRWVPLAAKEPPPPPAQSGYLLRTFGCRMDATLMVVLDKTHAIRSDFFFLTPRKKKRASYQSGGGGEGGWVVSMRGSELRLQGKSGVSALRFVDDPT